VYGPLLLLVYFIYGLAFLVMALTMLLEWDRSTASGQAWSGMALAIFGILHGIHEWLEFYLSTAGSLGVDFPGWLSWMRLVLLAASFLFLIVYGIGSFRQPGYTPLAGMRLGLAVMLPFAAGILFSAVFTYRAATVPWLDLLDGLSRYLLAFPGAAFGALALRDASIRQRALGNPQVARHYLLAACGFLFYGVTQFFVRPLEMFPALWINAEVFRTTFGFPVQILRSGAAVVITAAIVRVTQALERERARQLESAREERLRVMEQIQSEMAKREQMRRELLQHTVFCQEEERARIARELHDETSQTLSALSLDLATLKTMLPKEEKSQEFVDRLQSLNKQMAQGLYRLVHDLRPAQLDDLGLIPALQYLAEQDAPGKGLDIRLIIEGKKRRLDASVETVLYRIAQEALTNIARHAQTQQGTITLRFKTQQVVLQIEDRGSGFDLSKNFLPPQGWGLAGMRERVEAVGGDLSIRSEPGQGTTVGAVIPLYDLIP
jgi:signal transduction histidine kinase